MTVRSMTHVCHLTRAEKRGIVARRSMVCHLRIPDAPVHSRFRQLADVTRRYDRDGVRQGCQLLSISPWRDGWAE